MPEGGGDQDPLFAQPERETVRGRDPKPLLSRFLRGKEALLPTERVSRADLEQYRPNSSKFPKPSLAESFFHPSDHLARTLIWSDVMANLLPADQQSTIDRRVLRIASVLHDVGRGDFHLNKHTHGHIAAELVKDKTKLAELLPDANTQTLTEKQIEDIAYLIENHHQFNHAAAQIKPDMAPSLTALQTADGIDLARGNFALGGAIHLITDRTSAIDNALPIVKHTLRIPAARNLRTLASKFATQTQKDILNGKDRFTACLDTAQELSIINP